MTPKDASDLRAALDCPQCTGDDPAWTGADCPLCDGERTVPTPPSDHIASHSGEKIPTKTDREWAEQFFPPSGWRDAAIDDLAQFLARYRKALLATDFASLAEQVVGAANIVSHDGYYEIDIDAVTKILAAATPSPAQQSGELREAIELIMPVLRTAYACGYTDRPGDRDFSDSQERLRSDLIKALASTTPPQSREGSEDFLSELRRVNAERYDAWACQPLMLCEHCGRDADSAAASGHNFCIAPFDQQEHSFTRPHPYLTVSNDAGIMFDALELGGEVGELLNVVKKLEREDRGWRGSRASEDDFANEIGDVLICLDKLARRLGVDLAVVTAAKFNATSDKVGLPHKLRLASTEAPVSGEGM